MSESYIEYPYYSSEEPSGENGKRLCRKIVNRIKRLDSIASICELGCGNGVLATQIASSGYDVIGVDLSESGIKYAKAGAAKARFIQAKINLEIAHVLPPRSFDLVLSSEVIEHLYRPADLLEVASVLLKPRGLLLLTTPYHGYLKNLALAISNFSDQHFNPLWDGGHIKFFSVKTLSQLLNEHRFSVLEFSFFGRFPGFWKSMICLAQKQEAP